MNRRILVLYNVEELDTALAAKIPSSEKAPCVFVCIARLMVPKG